MANDKARVKLKFKKHAFGEILKSHGVREELKKRADRVAKSASDNGRVGGYMVTELVLEKNRSAVSVMATGHARFHNRKHHALLRALDAGKGQ